MGAASGAPPSAEVDAAGAAAASDAGGPAAADGEPAAADGSRASATDSDGNGTAIRDVSYDGVGVVRHDQNVTYVFADEPHGLVVQFATPREAGAAEICVTVRPSEELNGEAEEEDDPDGVERCTAMNGLDGVNHTTHLGFERWPANWTGEAAVSVAVSANDPASGGVDRATTNATVRALAHDEDLSGSGLTNAEELAYGTDFRRSDTDGDGLTDGDEVMTYGTDPLDRDTSGNGVSDGMEVLLGTNPTNWWTPHVFLFVFALLIGAGLAAITYRIAPLPRESAAAVGDGRGAAPAASGDAAPDPVVTDEERIHRLLEERGGRIRQQDIVEETGWSKSKVSRLLSRMEEEGQLSRVRIGRENIVTADDAVEVPTDDGD